METINTTERLAGLRELMRKNKVDIYIVPSEDSHSSEYIAACDARREFISGFSGSAGCAVVTLDKAALATDGRYFNQASRQLDNNWLLLKQGLQDVPTWQEWAAEQSQSGKVVGVDSTIISAPDARKLLEKVKKRGGSDLIAVEENLVDLVWGDDRPSSPKEPVKVLAREFCGKDVRTKLEDLRKELQKKKSSGFIVSMLDEIAWLFNLRGNDIPYNPVFFSYASVTPSSATLYVDSSKLSDECTSHLTENGVSIRDYSKIFGDVQTLSQSLNADDVKLKKFLVSSRASWALKRALGGDAKVDEVRSPIGDAKSIKNETELEGMRACHVRDGAALIEYFAWLEHQLVVEKVEIDEVAAADKLEQLRSKKKHFVGLSFDTISSTGANAAVIHYKPEPGHCSIIDPKAVYLCDSGAQYFDGTTDTTRTLHFGEPTEMEKKAYTLVLKGNIALDVAVFPKGTSGFALDALARQFLWEEGLDYRHGTGHGVGSFLNVHEGPIGIGTRIQYSEVPLAPGNVISNEPGYYEDGSFGVRIENIVMVKEVETKHRFGDKPYLGFEHVTMVPYCRKLIDETLLTRKEKHWLNEYHADIYSKTKDFFKGDGLTISWFMHLYGEDVEILQGSRAYIRTQMVVNLATRLEQETYSKKKQGIKENYDLLASNTIGTCEFRTINYITDILPQQCLRSSWSSTDSPLATKSKATDAPGTLEGQENDGGADTISNAPTFNEYIVQTNDGSGFAGEISRTSEVRQFTASSTPQDIPTPTASATAVDEGELNDASFLSFEEWKKQILEQAGQQDLNIGKRKSAEAARKRESEAFQNNLESLGDDGEIDLDFGAFRDGGAEQTSRTTEDKQPSSSRDSQEEKSDSGRRRDQHRSNDAGKTCKERFSYASFDAGATVLKTHQGAKNSKAVLIENKDSYMLSECKTQNKFLIIELSEDIWIDTLVLANYEFFSSMLRTFRVSVSDRWPVKMDKWKDLGVYEARNSREIQAFLVENPQIWARYIRIEFLSHYGKEYYCPLSLVRVHGTRMLESWKDTETNNDDDEEADEDPEDGFVPEAVAEVIPATFVTEVQAVHVTASSEIEPTGLYSPPDVQKEESPVETHLPPTSPWKKFVFEESEVLATYPRDLCFPSDAPEHILTSQAVAEEELSDVKSIMQVPPSPKTVSTTFTSSSLFVTGPPAQQTLSEDKASLASTSLTQESHESSKTTHDSSYSTTPTSSTTVVTNKPQNATITNKNRSTNIASGSASLPTIQESFFKAVSRRLQLLETNSTLSLKYIEEQSKMLREAFLKVERRQLQKTTDFLDNLNSTVLTELRVFRQQYDEIWQSTVISLESQREESYREILAISTRLNILADEVVFQKRMSIIQSVLLLLCLGLVIFSRVSSAEPLSFSLHSRRSRIRNTTSMESPLDTPGYTSREREDYIGSASSPVDPWPNQHRRHLSDDSLNSRSQSRGWGPTPISAYSRSDIELTPPRSFDDATTNIVAGATTGTFSRLRRSITMKYQNSNPWLPASKEHELLRTSSFGPSLRSQNSSPASFLSVADAKERGGKDRNPGGLASPPPSDIESHDYMDELNSTPTSAQHEKFKGRSVENIGEAQSLQTPTQEDPDGQNPLPALPDGSPSL
ncbi:putative Xaa-pro aminopeptidase P [Sclerotinia borealis F-4128]|uniref:Probable Xaa-Pro aminopeptidase P n=1 Tax=Sclerotinia borealis (strain F-4128) TaxID=1432307 RepID=W9CXI3_SCLBF|nr:putative Xaa-pro aminopeptidase P [Sclerotinia borealis F-4128]